MARSVQGTVYLLHFDEPIGNTASQKGYAQHYTGWASDLAARLAEHRRSSDVKILQAVRRAGISWSLARTWAGTRTRERQLKQRGAARRCPVCQGRSPAVEAGTESPAAVRQAVMSYLVTIPQPRPPAREPAPLWESVVSHLEPAAAAAFLGELEKAERAAWDVATPEAGQEYRARLDAACEISRLRGEEASAAERLAETRAIAQAEGWADEPPLAGPQAAGRPFDRQAAGRPELPRAEVARVKEETEMFGDSRRAVAAAEAAAEQAEQDMGDAFDGNHGTKAERMAAFSEATGRQNAAIAAQFAEIDREPGA